MGDAGADEKRDPGAREAADRGREREGAAAAFGGVLFGQPDRVHREVRTTDAEKEEHREERHKRIREIEDIAETGGDRHEHHGEVERERQTTSETLGEWRQHKAAE